MEGWLACLVELSMGQGPAPEFPESPVPYLPMILSGFDEEEYVTRPEEDEGAIDAIVAPSNKVANLAIEARRTVAEASGEKSTGEKSAEDAREDAARVPPAIEFSAQIPILISLGVERVRLLVVIILLSVRLSTLM